MFRVFIVFGVAAAIALSSAVVASTIARSGGARPYQAKADFDQAFSAAKASTVASTNLDPEKLRRTGLKRINPAQR
jgi:hypothetical protein